MYTVYALVDPRDNLVRYVGMTNDIYRRFRQHISCQTDNPEKNAWIAELKKSHVMLVMKTLETVEDLALVQEREIYWIAHYQAASMPLLNHVSQPEGTKTKVGRRLPIGEVKNMILFRLQNKSWPDEVSPEMREYYERNYINRNGKYYTKTRRWRAESKEGA